MRNHVSGFNLIAWDIFDKSRIGSSASRSGTDRAIQQSLSAIEPTSIPGVPPQRAQTDIQSFYTPETKTRLSSASESEWTTAINRSTQAIGAERSGPGSEIGLDQAFSKISLIPNSIGRLFDIDASGKNTNQNAIKLMSEYARFAAQDLDKGRRDINAIMDGNDTKLQNQVGKDFQQYLTNKGLKDLANHDIFTGDFHSNTKSGVFPSESNLTRDTSAREYTGGMLPSKLGQMIFENGKTVSKEARALSQEYSKFSTNQLSLGKDLSKIMESKDIGTANQVRDDFQNFLIENGNKELANSKLFKGDFNPIIPAQ